jgi:predicted Na+-dependent transporter
VFVWKWVEKGGSAVGAVFLLLVLVYGVITNYGLSESVFSVWLVAALMQPIGCAFGYFVAKLLKLEPKQRRTISLETGVQNSSLIIAVVAISWEDDVELRDKILTVHNRRSLQCVWCTLTLLFSIS